MEKKEKAGKAGIALDVFLRQGYKLNEPIRRWIKDTAGYVKDFTQVEQLLHRQYARGSFPFNARLRHSKEDKTDEEYEAEYPLIALAMELSGGQSWDELIEYYLYAVSEDGFELPAMHLWRGSHRYQEFKKGDILIDPGFTSFTLNLSRAYRYYNLRNKQEKGDFTCCIFHLHVERNTVHGIYHPAEEQVVFGPGVKFRIIDIRNEIIQLPPPDNRDQPLQVISLKIEN
jgi:hypothetical protein